MNIPDEVLSQADSQIISPEGLRAAYAVIAEWARRETLREAANEWHQPHDPSTYAAADWLAARAEETD